MNWLNKHMPVFFKIMGFSLIITLLLNIWGMYLFSGLPNNGPFEWTSYQWHMINFLWIPTLIDTIIYLFLAALCFKNKYFVFPAIALYLILYSLGGDIGNLIQIIEKGFIDPAFNMIAIVHIITFIMSLIGIVFWVNKLTGKFSGWLHGHKHG